MRERAFAQVDVFTATPYRGNPVAVVLDGTDLADDEMAAFARWTNLSETTFVLPPTDPATADYRLRIFTPGGELPFAGHPTLGSAHAWLAAGGRPRDEGTVVQECGIGLVRLRRDAGRLAFAAPPLRRSGPVAPEVRARVVANLRLPDTAVVACEWIDNGPPWIGVVLADAHEVLTIRPDPAAVGDLFVGVVGPWGSGHDADVEVRGFIFGEWFAEDPVTGSLNAGLARWLVGNGTLPTRYVAAQGTALQRRGRVHVEQLGDDLWIGGDTTTCIEGSVLL
ncbi:PhzF family phenazine biosynthesis protein [Cellulomonas phragmiteti]|uniref:Phenazine biosynthesis protein PhzF n=1 Tax=Cellulomonas phragmiteti TaxID=478780 RepID=A0ABQ4DIP1_9CELL|nr:PhzF family phenazine biosynthesis protein [Cellulomonas phragmiteti]GIG39219.1 phenazine biosynthesis protein PhzF [Cellulomonas phragmiteti]